MNHVQIEDCQSIGEKTAIIWDEFRNSTVLVTGSTGLIGSNLVNALAYNNEEKSLGIKLVLPVRNMDLARKRFGWTGAEFLPYSLDGLFDRKEKVDYIVHLAGPTSSQCFVNKPVETMKGILEGYTRLLDWAVSHPVKKFVGASTMEVYGFPKKGERVTENSIGTFNPLVVRNSYPIAKLACEALCYNYFCQYDVPAMVLRFTQTMGPGVDYNDRRVFAQFMRCVIEGKDIVLDTEGLTERSYLYTADAVSAIILAMLNATPGKAYSVANPETYCSIREMANTVAREVADGNIAVKVNRKENSKEKGYADTLYMDLDVSAMEELGWYPVTDISTMFRRMIRGTKEDVQSGCSDEYIQWGKISERAN